MTHDEQVQAVVEAANEVGGTVRDSYSGRGMGDRTCYGIVCYSDEECIEAAARNGLRGARVDCMGTRRIVYWPSIVGKD